MRKKFLLHILLMLSLPASIFIQADAGNDRTSARLVGMARANAAAARGLDAVGINPALLSVPQRAAVEVSLIPAGVRFGSNFMDYNLYSTYFTGVDDPVTGERVAKHLTPQDKQNILDSFPNGHGKIHADAQVLWLGVSMRTDYFGGLALTISDRFSMNFIMPDDYMRMLFDGFSEIGSTYDFSGTEAQSWWIREYSISYGTPRLRLVDFLPWISFGGGIKRVEGYAYFGTESYEGFISNKGFDEGFMLGGEMNMVTRWASANFLHDPDVHEFRPMSKPAGMGWGFDAGIAAGITKDVVVGLSVTDVGFIRWTENTYRSTGDAIVEIDELFSSEQQDSLRDAYLGKNERSGAFATSLSAAIRAGASWQVNEKLLLAADYTQGLNNMPANSTIPRGAVGMEWRPVGFLPLRSGVAVGGHNGFTWAFGFGFNSMVFDLGIATENIGLLVYPDKSKQASVTVATKFRF